jgi:hypothetical protein
MAKPMVVKRSPWELKEVLRRFLGHIGAFSEA